MTPAPGQQTPTEVGLCAESSASPEALLNATEHWLYRQDHQQQSFAYCSPGFVACMAGQPLGDGAADHLWQALLSPEGHQARRQQLIALAAEHPGGTTRTTLQLQAETPAGPRILADSLSIESSPGGDLLWTTGILVDITAATRTATLLQERDAQFQALTEAALVGVAILQRRVIRYANQIFCRWFGYQSEELLGQYSAYDLVVPEDHPLLETKLARPVSEDELTLPVELSGLRRDGSRFPLLALGKGCLMAGHPALVVTLIDLSAQQATEAALAASRNRFRALFNGARDALLIVNTKTRQVAEVNQQACQLFGLPRHSLSGRALSDLLPDTAQAWVNQLLHPDRPDPGDENRTEASENQRSPLFETTIASHSGISVPVELSGTLIDIEDAVPVAQLVLRDLSERKRIENELHLAWRVFENSDEMIVITDSERQVIAANPAFLKQTGYALEEIRGNAPSLWRSGQHSPEFYADMWQQLAAQGCWQGEVWNKRRNGEVFPAWLTISVCNDAAGQPLNYIGISSDITERHAAQQRIHQLAFYDPLTNLPNRTLLKERASQALTRAKRQQVSLAVMFIDLDHFKTINDSLGHSVGDELLVEVAQRLQSCIRQSDTVARLGGDEFVVLANDVHPEQAAELARKILTTISQPVQLREHEFKVTPSLGVSIFPTDGEEFEILLKHADIAMYQAKETGRANFHFFSREMNIVALERLVLENSLRLALARDEFQLYYQPQIDLATGSIVGAEALLRWQHPQIGLIGPQRFISIAEESSLIVDIGRWVLHNACHQAKAWQAAGLTSITVAVNLSPRQFRQGKVEEEVHRALAASGLDCAHLELELTEGMIMSDAEETIRELQRLSAIGVQLAVDDFGTGYSNLFYLKRYPLDRLKIDQSFIRGIVANSDDRAIASAIIAMGRSLRLAVVAEGVETRDELETLTQMGCPLVQGYHYSRPLPADEFGRLLKQQPFVIEEQ